MVSKSKKNLKEEHHQLKNSEQCKGGWTSYLVLAGIATTLGSSLPVGYNIGVVNTPAKVITSFCNESLISRYDVRLDAAGLDILWSSIVSIFIVGGCVGSLLGTSLANGLGRKKATLVPSLLSLAGASLFLFSRTANSVEMLLLGRLLVGLSAGLTTSIVPMYLTELSPARLTGAMGVVCPMGVNVGVFVGQVMGLEVLLGKPEDWTYLLSAFAILVIICIPILIILPESPMYLFVVRRNEEVATKELSRLRGVSTSLLTNEINSLRAQRTGGTQRESSWGLMRVACDPGLRLSLLLIVAMQAGQQTSGINAVFYYSASIFTHAGLSEFGAQIGTIACGLINVLTAAWMTRLLSRSGRRPLLLASTGAATIALAALALTTTLMSVVWWMPYLSTACVMVYVLAYGFGLGPIPYFIASEMLEVGPRPAGMAWGSLANWLGNFLVGMTFKPMRSAVGPYCFLIFAAITGALFVFLKLYFPETRAKTPAQVSQLCSRGFRSRPLSRSRPELNDV